MAKYSMCIWTTCNLGWLYLNVMALLEALMSVFAPTPVDSPVPRPPAT
jgi:hypothetical protein